jgi:hypothetical protein
MTKWSLPSVVGPRLLPCREASASRRVISAFLREPGVFLFLATALLAQPAVVSPTAQGFPFADETLNYTLSFSSGIRLGKAILAAHKQPNRGWTFNLDVDASLPGFPIVDHFQSGTGLDLCSIHFERNYMHGRFRKAQEVIYFDRGRSVAVRSTKNGGGISEIPVGLCPHDALSFLYLLRREMGQGRMPPNDVVIAGAAYRVSMVYDGEKAYTLNKQPVRGDQVICTIKGPASQTRLEILFARDAARTPLLIRCPLALGTFTLELVR